ncbi:MAG: DUF4926 domain-containing protein [Pseudomonadota bacterium]|nr:DUF4926 domain-containing protein [Pseudomonadota bacterium]
MTNDLDFSAILAATRAEGSEMVYAHGAAYEVEFMTLGGNTLAVLTLSADHARPVDSREIAHVRKVA